MRSKRYLHQADMPEHQAYFALIDGILAVDRGDFGLGVLQLDRAISIAQPIKASYILSNAYTALLFAAIATASREDAQRAMHGYSTSTMTTMKTSGLLRCHNGSVNERRP